MTEQVQTARSAEELAAQKSRNRWIALALVIFVVLVGTTTAIRIQSADLSTEGGFYFSGALEADAPKNAQEPSE